MKVVVKIFFTSTKIIGIEEALVKIPSSKMAKMLFRFARKILFREEDYCEGRVFIAMTDFQTWIKLHAR